MIIEQVYKGTFRGHVFYFKPETLPNQSSLTKRIINFTKGLSVCVYVLVFNEQTLKDIP